MKLDVQLRSSCPSDYVRQQLAVIQTGGSPRCGGVCLVCPSAWGAEAGLLELHNELQVILVYDAVSVKTEKIQNTKQEGENLICAKHLLCAGQHPEELFTHCFTYTLIFIPAPNSITPSLDFYR